MKEIIEWLISYEKMVGGFYNNAANLFRDDKRLSDFLEHLAKDEEWHCSIMSQAAECIKDNGNFTPIITLDNTTKEEIAAPFKNNKKFISKGNLSKEQLIDFIVTTEFSEWNDIFLYVVNSIKNKRKNFMHAAAMIQQHKIYIENFVESLPYGHKYLSKIRELPEIWQKRLLVVDDSSIVIQMLLAIFRKEFIIETAENGEEAFQKTNKQYFDVIISDVDMPVLNGMEFYKKAISRDPNIRENFLFFTASLGPNLLIFFETNNLFYIQKPAAIKDIRKTVNDIMQR